MAPGKMTIVRTGPKMVGAHVPAITKKAFERFGFPQAALLTDWEAIIGPELARFTEPERLKWPRPSENAPDDESQSKPVPAGKMRKPPRDFTGATLVLRVDGPLAIEVQHKSVQIIERINGYFGFRAVTELRILQAPVVRKLSRPVPPRQPPPVVPLPPGTTPLEQALLQLGRHVKEQANNAVVVPREKKQP